MGVYIKGMEMPKFCGECRFCVDGWCYAIPEFERQPSGINRAEKTRWCPLVPVPPHGRLGDLDAALKKLNRICLPDDLSYTIGHDIAKQFLKDAPTIIPADEPFGKSEQLNL